jgi:hypothetical protein
MVNQKRARGLRLLAIGLVSASGLSACPIAVERSIEQRRIGEPCVADSLCTDGLCIREQTTSEGAAWMDGYCSMECSQNDCPEGTCVPFAGGEAYCATTCSAGGECRSGYVCATAVGACLPDCRSGWSCGDLLQCDEETGTCGADASDSKPTKEPNPIGAACQLNADCSSNLCTPEVLDSTSTGWVGGYCTQSCADSACPSGSTCIPFADGTSFCDADCTQPADCRTGYVCAALAAVCLPDCRNGWSCGTELSCDDATGACIAAENGGDNSGAAGAAGAENRGAAGAAGAENRGAAGAAGAENRGAAGAAGRENAAAAAGGP